MWLLKKLEQYILSEDQAKLLARADKSRITLTIYLCALWAVLLIFYAITDILSGVFYALPGYALFILSLLVAFFLLKKQKYDTGKIVLIISGDLVVFYASMADPIEAGAIFLFIPVSMCAFAMMDYREIRKIFLMNGLVILLFLVSYFKILDVDVPTPSEQYVQISFIVNFLISIITCSLILYFLINLNFESEKNLVDKEHSVLAKNNELEKINKELDRFVYSVSHDLRSPLSSILGIVNLSKHTNKAEELKEYFNLVEGRIKVQDEFIKNITDYSRNVRVEVSKEKISLQPLVHEVIDSLRFLPGAESIDFRILLNDDLTITTDRLRLCMVLSNLLSNAIKYSDPYGKAAFVEIGVQMNHKESILYIRDNGIGISNDWLPKIFDMFTRATERSSGSGLGLFITKETVEKIGGSLSVESTLGEGSTFLIHLAKETEFTSRKDAGVASPVPL
jgi:signal transduction histidine kinase